jgi:hypothetical protein
VRPLLALSVLVVGVFVVVAVRGEGPPPERGATAAPPTSLLAVDGGGRERRLLRVDPVSLRPIGGPTARLTAASASRRVRLAAPVEGWARSPSGSELAAVTDRGTVVRLFDVTLMRSLGRLRTGARGVVASVQWTRPDRLWVVLARPGCCALGSTTVVAIDPVARRVVARRLVGGGLARVAATPDGPVLLLAPPAVIGPGTLATVDDDGRVEELRLDGMSAGVLPTEGIASVDHVRTPALAVDAARRRAFILSSRPHAVEVDLTNGRVRHHRLVPRPSLTDRVRELIDPSAEAAALPDGRVPAPPDRSQGAVAASPEVAPPTAAPPEVASPAAAPTEVASPAAAPTEVAPPGTAAPTAVAPPAAADPAVADSWAAAVPRPRVGRVRTAAWLGAARLAVSGHDEFVVLRGGDVVEDGRRPAGLRIVDTRDWSVRTLDERVDGFRTAGGLLLTGGSGLAAYAPDGAEVFRLLAGSRVEIVATAGSLAYVRTPPADELRVVDLADGRVIGTAARDRPRLLLETGPRGW